MNYEMDADFGWDLPPGVTHADIERAQGTVTDRTAGMMDCECDNAEETSGYVCSECDFWWCPDCGQDCECPSERPEDDD